MSAAEEPWGFIATGTLHLYDGDSTRPLCNDQKAVSAIKRLRDRWDRGETVSLLGYADTRSVCRKCIANSRSQAERLIKRADQAEAWNGTRT